MGIHIKLLSNMIERIALRLVHTNIREAYIYCAITLSEFIT
jgi:hypothetical protein